jgi:hypothetical protein
MGVLIFTALLLSGEVSVLQAQTPATPPADSTKRLDIYGFAMLDMGFDIEQNNPDWFDVVRPTKLPSFQDEFGKDGRWFSGVRQTRFGVKSSTPTDLGDLKTIFEFELYGVGVDAGQTTFRLRHAWGELGHFGAGQTWSAFMDPDVFPNSIEYWGPNGMVFFRNVQFRWMPLLGTNEAVVTLERPGASGDAGRFSDRIELQNVVGRFPVPDLAAHYKRSGDWGHVQLAGIVRRINWDDTLVDAVDLSGDATGWGVNVSGNYKIAKDTLRLEATYGEGIQNYMNDAAIDVAVQTNVGNRVTPLLGVTLPMFAMVAFYDHSWSDKFTSSIGYSMLDNDNANGERPDAFNSGQYALTNLLYTPVTDVMVGGEFQWGQRENNSDGFRFSDYRVQFSFKYNFSYTLLGSK